MTNWTMRHESDSLMQTAPRDLCGLRFAKDCGYLWINKNDGNGWLQTSLLIRREEIRCAVAEAA